METIGFGLAIIAEARYLVNSIQTRLQNYRQGPAAFQTLTTDLDHLAALIGEVEKLLQAAPSALPPDTCAILNTNCTRVRESLVVSNTTMQELTHAFAGSSSSVKAKVKSVLHRTVRAKAYNAKMSTIETQVKYSSNQLLHLISTLTMALKSQETQDVLVAKMEDLNIADNAEPAYRCPTVSAPALRPTVILNFDVRNSDGELEIPEGKLKNSLLSSVLSTDVTAAAGVLKPTYGVVGMAGVGKTIALQGLAYDEDIRECFYDGVLYMSLGQGATLQRVIAEIDRIMKMTGARLVERSASLRDVIDEAVLWFSGKVCLFLVDDLWPTPNCATGYLRDLQQLLRDSPRSRMAITTRSVEIARDAGAVVHFDARDPTGTGSEALFMKYATASLQPEVQSEHDPEVRSSISKILSLCGGLPIALAVTGCGVAQFASLHGNFKSACASYATQLENKTVSLGEEKIPGGMSLNASILLSLECLAAKWNLENSQDIDHSISDLYTSLCVLGNQSWVPVSVLSRLWKLDESSSLNVAKRFGEMSLASLSVRELRNGSSECGLLLHDLQLEFCQRQAKKTKTWSTWHARMLNGYLVNVAGTDARSLKNLTSFTPRPWWSERVPEDDYVHHNLARHLTLAGSEIELGALLLDARWTHLRLRIGGILALKADFEFWSKSIGRRRSTEGNQTFLQDVEEGFHLILKALEHSWGRASDGERSLLFQLCGRLHTIRDRNEIVAMYLKSMKDNTRKPYLVPVNSFFPELHRALIMELALSCPVTCSPCGRYIAARADVDIAIVDALSYDIIQRLKGPTDYVNSIAFSAESTKVIAGSRDKTVVVWKWEQSGLPVQLLKGHIDAVICVAVSSDDQRIFSGSWDCTLRVWDSVTGTQTAVVEVEEHVRTLVLCSNGRSAILGLGNGTLKVVDIGTGAVEFEDHRGHELGVTSLALSPNGVLLASASYGGTTRLWNTETWTRVAEFREGHRRDVISVAFSPDGQRIASGSKDGCIRVWSVETGRKIGVSPNMHSAVQSVMFSPDGKRIISGYAAGMVRIWDAMLDTKFGQRHDGHSAPVRGVAISHDGVQVVTGSEDGALRLWDSQTGSQIGVPMEGHTGWVNCVSFSPESHKVVSGSTDGTVRLWDTEEFAQVGDPLRGHAHWVHSVSFSFDGLRIVSGSRDGTIRIWNVETREQIGGALEAGVIHTSGVSESSDGCHIVVQGTESMRNSTSIIWHRERRAIVWRSKGNEICEENEIGFSEAENIVRSCGQLTPHVWPDSFPTYSAELYCTGTDVYSNALCARTLLAALPTGASPSWSYDRSRRLFAAGLESNAVALCKLMVD